MSRLLLTAIVLAHDALGAADEMIPAILAGVLLATVLVLAFIEHRKAKMQHRREKTDP